VFQRCLIESKYLLLKNMSKHRQINIELLRIWSMLMVLFIHFHETIFGRVTHEMVMDRPWTALAVAGMSSLSFVCVNCFIVISGYFGIHWQWSGLFKYLFQISFWGGLVHLLAVALGLSEFSILHMLDNMTLFLVNGNWFFVSYLGLYLFAPILNAYIDKASGKDLGRIVLAFYCMQTLFGWIFKNCQEFNQGLSFVSFIGLYLLGSYLKRTDLKCFQWSSITNVGLYFGVGAVSVSISMVSNYMGFPKDVFSYISPLQILQTIFLFLACKSLKLKENEKRDKVILFFSTSAFAVLLMHSWDGCGFYWGGLSWIYANMQHPFLASIAFMLLFFVSACCLDKIRMFLSKRLFF